MITVSGDRHVKSKKAALVAAFFCLQDMESIQRGGNHAGSRSPARVEWQDKLGSLNMFTCSRTCAVFGAALVAATGQTHAQVTPITLTPGTSISVPSPYLLDVSKHITFNGAGSSGTLAFSVTGYDGVDPGSVGGFVHLIQAAGIRVTAEGGSYQTAKMPWSAELVAAEVSGLKVNKVTVDDKTGSVLSFSTQGGYVLSAAPQNQVLAGGEARVANLRFDLVHKQVVADLSGTSLATKARGPVRYALPDTVMWTFGDSTGPVALPMFDRNGVDEIDALKAQGYDISPLGDVMSPQSYIATARSTFSGLAVTEAGQNFLVGALGALNVVKAVLTDIKGDHGTFRTQFSYTVGVPEPQTHALMGLGLLAMAWAVRENSQRKA